VLIGIVLVITFATRLIAPSSRALREESGKIRVSV
jgi:hypothetical protein